MANQGHTGAASATPTRLEAVLIGVNGGVDIVGEARLLPWQRATFRYRTAQCPRCVGSAGLAFEGLG